MINARIKAKHDTTENWNNCIGFIPLSGEIIIYDDYKVETYEENGVTVTKNIPGIKIGSGNAYVQDLAFVDEDLNRELTAHLNNGDIHITPAEKILFANKVNIDDLYETLHEELHDETLVFNRN